MNRQALGFLAVLGTLRCWGHGQTLGSTPGDPARHRQHVPSFQERFIGWVGYSPFKWGEGMGSVSKDMPQPPKTDL